MRLLWVTDIHHPAVSGEHYRRSGPAFDAFAAFVAALEAAPDLIVASGDIVNRGSARIDDLEVARAALESLGAPLLVCPGNHDLAPSRKYAAFYPGMEDMEEMPLASTNFGRVFGPEGLRAEIDPGVGRWRIVSFALRDEDPDGQLDWLEESLARSGPVLVFGHYPVLRSRSGGYCAGWGYSRIGAVRERLEAILRRDGSTTLYCSGHQHINSVVSSGALTQIVTGALGHSPYCFRWIELEEHRARIDTVLLNGFDDRLDDASNPDRSADDEHPDVESYHLGLPRERSLEIAV